MQIKIENEQEFWTLMHYLEEQTDYRWAAGQKPTDFDPFRQLTQSIEGFKDKCVYLNTTGKRMVYGRMVTNQKTYSLSEFLDKEGFAYNESTDRVSDSSCLTLKETLEAIKELQRKESMAPCTSSMTVPEGMMLYPLREESKQRKEGVMQKLSKTLKRVLNKDMQAMYKAGYIDGDLDLTARGLDALRSIQQAEYEEQLAEMAREELE